MSKNTMFFIVTSFLIFNCSKRRYIVDNLMQIVFPLQTDKTIYYVDAFG